MANYRSLEEQARDYFAWRRKLGFRPQSETESVLRFARRVDARRLRKITLDTVVEWARDSPKGGPRYISERYEAVRRFLLRIASERPGVVVPPPGYLGGHFVRQSVHIYSREEVKALTLAALELPPKDGLRAHTVGTLVGLLDATGIRIGEALALDVEDVNLKAGTIHIKRDKVGGSRLLPLHETTVRALQAYSDRRNVRYPIPKPRAFFLTNSRNTRLRYRIVSNTFRHLRRTLGWHALRPAPRIHDLRHTFAVRKLLEWMRAGKDVDAELPALTAYLGHAKPQSTYWYFSAVPELGHLITGNMERLEDLRLGSPVI